MMALICSHVDGRRYRVTGVGEMGGIRMGGTGGIYRITVKF